MRLNYYAHAVMVVALLGSSAAAANPNHFDYSRAERPSPAGYVGLTISLRQIQGRKAAPDLRIGAGLRYQGSLGTVGAGPVARNALLEFGVARKPAITFGGRRLSVAEGSGLGAKEIMLGIVAVAATAFLISQVAGSGDDDDERCLIEPELCR